MAITIVTSRFPFISLEKALQKAQQLFDGDRGGKAMPVTTAFELWGYSPKSSGGFQTTSALKAYGLIEDEGANADRKVKLTGAARRYFLDERDDVRAEMLAEFALRPGLFQVLWSVDRWEEGIPADTVARSHLKLERNLNDQSARAALGIFKENIQFAGIKAGMFQDEAFETQLKQPELSKPDYELERTKPMEVQVQERPLVVSALDIPGAPDVRLIGDRVIIAANVDLKGLRKLRRQLAMFEQMLTMGDDDEESDQTGP